MKIDAKGTSKYLAKVDVPQPLLATMDFVRIETLHNPTEDKPILHFIGAQIKPMVLNVVNRKVLIAAYGDETDNWKGRMVEIYVNPDVTNSGGEVVGGVRVRIPAAKPSMPKSLVPPMDPHAKTLHGLRVAKDSPNADAWFAWGAKIPGRTPAQKKEQELVHKQALERIALSEGQAAEPELAEEPELVGAGVSDKDIPF